MVNTYPKHKHIHTLPDKLKQQKQSSLQHMIFRIISKGYIFLKKISESKTNNKSSYSRIKIIQSKNTSKKPQEKKIKQSS